ncbi:MAG: HAD family phosphatase [Bacteroides sp.]|nr:HAD family phosphatase [Bacteroides sp.]MCM1413785.1 HAD family phosphatase [Bacteroides sp.]MCM1472196.1 HAD family phosphatase [Bacteroides sp.]
MIKNLLFDLGGVIMNIRRRSCVEAFERLGMKDADTLLGEYEQSGVFAGIENGSLSPEQFHDEIRRIIGRDVTDKEIDDAFCAFLIGIPTNRLDALEEYHKHFRCYVLSNTNPIMWNSKIASEFRKQGHNIDYYFDGTVTSFEVKAMKPDPKIFEAVVEKYGIKPEETLFLDDSNANCEAAERIGFKTLHVAPGTEMYDLLKQYPGL